MVVKPAREHEVANKHLRRFDPRQDGIACVFRQFGLQRCAPAEVAAVRSQCGEVFLGEFTSRDTKQPFNNGRRATQTCSSNQTTMMTPTVLGGAFLFFFGSLIPVFM